MRHGGGGTSEQYARAHAHAKACTCRCAHRHVRTRYRRARHANQPRAPSARTALYVMQLFHTRLTSCLNSLGEWYLPLSSRSCRGGGGRAQQGWGPRHARESSAG